MKWIKWLYRQYLFWTVQDDRSAEDFLKLLDSICGWLAPLWFVGVFASRLFQSDYFRNREFTLLILHEGLPLFLIALFGLIYFLSRHSAKKELAIGKTLFPPGRLPNDLQLKDRMSIAIQVGGFVALYMVLAYFADHIMVVSFCMFVIACIDFNTRRQINERMRRYFSDPQYAPSPNERGIQARRAVATWFLFDLPHLWKEAGRILGCAVALAISVSSYVENKEQQAALAYVVLIATMIINETITQRWRFARDRRLTAIQER
jgi:hypothetical protein